MAFCNPLKSRQSAHIIIAMLGIEIAEQANPMQLRQLAIERLRAGCDADEPASDPKLERPNKLRLWDLLRAASFRAGRAISPPSQGP